MKKSQDVVFYILSFTWGCIMSFIGLIGAIVLLLTKHKPKIFHRRLYFEVGENWGGVNLGPIFLVSKNSGLSTKLHECGHGLQNAILGPVMPFIVCIPSAIRYWLYDSAEKERTFLYLLSFIFVPIAMLLVSILFLIGQHFIGFFILFAPIVYLIAIDFWLIVFESKNYFKKPFPEYDSIWFEKSATTLGNKYFQEEIEE